MYKFQLKLAVCGIMNNFIFFFVVAFSFVHSEVEIIFGANVGAFERSWGIFSLHLASGEINKIHEYKKGPDNSQGSKTTYLVFWS
jgi:hypothetical protein